MRSSHGQNMVDCDVMRPRRGQTASGGSWKLADRFFECLKTKRILALIRLLLIAGAIDASVTLVAVAADPGRTPQYYKFDEAARAALRGKPECAMVVGNTAKRLNRSGEMSVYLRSVDGVSTNSSEWLRAFVPAGSHRVVVDVEGTGWTPTEFIPPGIEVTFLPQHFYHLTAKQKDHQDLVQFWDETEGTDKRTLVKEFRFVEGNRNDGR